MSLNTSMHKRAELSIVRGARNPGLGSSAQFPAGDAVLLAAVALLALSTFEVAAWLATASLTTLICAVAFVPTMLFLVVACSQRQR